MEVKKEPEEVQQNIAKRKSEEEFFDFSAQMPKAKKIKTEEVKKDPEGNFLALPREAPKVPKAKVKREVTRKEINFGKPRTNSSKFQCKICQKYLCDRKTLNGHIELHYQPASYDCKKCERSFVKKANFKAHKCQQQFECDHCGKILDLKFKTKVHVLIHQVHQVECEICNAKMKPLSLEPHMRLIHNSAKVECPICNKIYKNTHRLRMHQKTHEIKRFECGKCAKKFSTQGDLNQHMKFHKNPEQFRCQICGLQTTAIGDLKKLILNFTKSEMKS